MPIVKDPKEVEEIYDLLREKNVCLPTFCTESHQMTEVIIRTFYNAGIKYGIDSPPAVIAFTANYPYRPQSKHYTITRNTNLGYRAAIDDIKLLMSESSPFKNVRLMIHLDHAQPEADIEIINRGLDELATIMYDCSAFPFEENMKKTAQFVDNTKNIVRVEGAVDEISVTGKTTLGGLTTVEMADKFIRETGAYLIVPNLGTEQQSTENIAYYDSRQARAISRKVGKRLVLHGTSCLSKKDLQNLIEDGIIRTNIWTSLETKGAQSVAKFFIEELGNILDESEIRNLQKEGFLGNKYFEADYREKVSGGRIVPKVEYISQKKRTEIWVKAVEKRISYYLDIFDFHKLAS
jgi:fructose-bisphosphate aldolase class II